MLRLMWQAVTGYYQPQGDRRDALVVLDLAFGYRNDRSRLTPGSGNLELAVFSALNFSKQSHLAQDEVAIALQEECQVGGPIISFGTIGIRITAKQLIARQINTILASSDGPALVTSSHLAPRAVAIARKKGLTNLIVPPGLPRAFDRKSAQWWTRNRFFWALKEPLVILYHRCKDWI